MIPKHKKMAGKDQYTAQQMIDALTKAKGMKTVAARLLGCDYKTVVRYIENYATVKQALDDSKESLGDSIETTLLAEALGIRDDNGKWTREPNITALIFLAKTHPVMRERGYAERREVTGKDGAPMQHKVTLLSELSDDELDDILDE